MILVLNLILLSLLMEEFFSCSYLRKRRAAVLRGQTMRGAPAVPHPASRDLFSLWLVLAALYNMHELFLQSDETGGWLCEMKWTG